ncbi:unnamed protein product [Cladocopium goreaui]|uniref:Uncharacterized protein n=1 Tax=Cladocopium goreaui TaxID=2562237 RepID=A0A9P1CCN9_9DINO|nr:unnamed protein product [Cladocopium goreaui]
MIQHHKRPHLNVPQFVIDEWKTRDQNTVAQILMDANWGKATFVAQLEVIVTKKKTVSVRVEEQWMTEKEMKSELQWTPARIAGAKKTCEAKGESHCRKNAYDGEQEYYIVTKEVGARQEERTQEEIHRSQKKADDGPTLDKDAFDGLAKAAARKAADDADADPNNPGGTGGSQIHETKSTFTKFMQSMLQKSGKIRSLVRELKEKYANCDTTSENVNLLQTGLKTMDEEYDKCSNLMAQAQLSGFDKVSSTFFRQLREIAVDSSLGVVWLCAGRALKAIAGDIGTGVATSNSERQVNLRAHTRGAKLHQADHLPPGKPGCRNVRFGGDNVKPSDQVDGVHMVYFVFRSLAPTDPRLGRRKEASFYAFDLFHSFHLGVGKILVASCLALASELMAATSVDNRLEELTSLYLVWAEENKKLKHFAFLAME